MLNSLRQISILNKLFNVNGNEWPKIGFSWTIRFLYRVGFVIGWTIIVAMFVGKYGIASLPYLFVMNAFFTILGSVFYSSFLHKFKKSTLMTWTLLTAAVILFVAYLFSSVDLMYFFLLLVVAEAVFLVQFKIILNGYIEEMFTPLESERTFPLIEASETIGGIVAGLAITFLAGSMDTFNFVLIWFSLVLLIIPLIFMYEAFCDKVCVIGLSDKSEARPGILSKLRREFSNKKHMRFIIGLFVIVFLQWFLYNLLEFQYTKAVYQNVSNVVLEAGSGFEHAFVHDLGILFVLFSASSLLVQLFIGSRLINYLGVVGSMILHTIVTFLSLVSLIFSFNFTTAILAKNNFTITSIVHTNAYHSAYYAVKDKLREHTRELLEGVVRPIGAIAGTSLLIVLQKLFYGDDLVFAVNLTMIVVTLIFFYVSFAHQKKYTDVALSDLVDVKSKHVRFNAIDILAQRGHVDSLPTMRKVLMKKKEPVAIKVRILRAFAELQSLDAIPVIVKCFHSERTRVREAAIDALLSYKNLKRVMKKNMAIEYDLVNSLRTMYKKEASDDIKSKSLSLLSRISTIYTVDFLLDVLKRSKGNTRADVLYALGNYSDPSISHLIKPYLRAHNARQRASAAIALGRHKQFQNEVNSVLSSFMRSKNKNYNAYAIFIIGELGLKDRKDFCAKHLNSKNSKLKMHSAIALAKMNDKSCVPVLVDLLFCKRESVAAKVKKMLSNVDVRISKNVDKIVKHMVSEEVDNLIEENGDLSLDDLSREQLINLRWLYNLVEEYDEVDIINNVIRA